MINHSIDAVVRGSGTVEDKETFLYTFNMYENVLKYFKYVPELSLKFFQKQKLNV